jgi:septal ring factor EnvC (AmiA/AmiB activator)
MLKGFYVFFILILLTYQSNAQQSRSSLENQRKDLNRQIETTSKNLEKTSKSRKLEAKKLETLQEKVKSRSEKLSGIRTELNSINAKIDFNSEKIAEHSAELENIKLAYKKVLLLLYRNNTTFRLIDLIFAPEEFHEQYIRHYYLKKLQKSYYQKASKLMKEQEQMNDELKFLNSNKAEKKQKLRSSKEQGGDLNDELEKQEKQFRELSSKETKLKKELAVQEASKKKLNLKIEQLIKEQISASKNSSRSYESAKNKNNSGNYTDINYTETGSFAAKKGQLPKPIKGNIVSGFGKHRHPIFEQIYTYNNGIDFKASSATAVRAVHDGIVVSVFAVPGNGNAVMLKHGEFYSTYSNLETVSAKRGDKLKTGAQLGMVGRDINSGNYILHFEIWEGKNKEDPEEWLK